MPKSIASLKRENSNLKDQLSVKADEIAKMKEMLLEQSKKPAATKDETVQSLEFMSEEYDDFERFRVSAGKERKRLSAKLEELAVELNKVSRSIDEFQEYSYQYNVKIVGVPQMSQDESSAITSALCERLFKAMGSAVSIQDINTDHRVPTRNNGNGRPRPIILEISCQTLVITTPNFASSTVLYQKILLQRTKFAIIPTSLKNALLTMARKLTGITQWQMDL